MLMEKNMAFEWTVEKVSENGEVQRLLDDCWCIYTYATFTGFLVCGRFINIEKKKNL